MPDQLDVPVFKTIALMRRGRLLTLTLNRPDAMNAANLAMHDELPEALAFAGSDGGTSLTGDDGKNSPRCSSQWLGSSSQSFTRINSETASAPWSCTMALVVESWLLAPPLQSASRGLPPRGPDGTGGGWQTVVVTPR